jgi:hypothetical protein
MQSKNNYPVEVLFGHLNLITRCYFVGVRLGGAWKLIFL